MLYFCTLFDSNYAAKGLAMYHSLAKQCSHFHLYIFAFDEQISELLKKLRLINVTVVSLIEFEDVELLFVKPTRSNAEYCWTSTSSTILYCLNNYGISHCTYIDADLYFFSNPKVLLEEMGIHDVLIIEHRYTSEFDVSVIGGKYCVQFMTFKNTENGLKVLNWWRNACLEWCYARVEDGKFGDQKYLDDWTIRFDGIHELKHLGGGVAPWNMQQYTFSLQDTKWIGTENETGSNFELVFFHFHAMLSFQKGVFREFYFQAYPLPASIRKFIYMPYVSRLINQNKQLKQLDCTIDGLATKQIELSWWKYLKMIRKRILNKDNKYRYWMSLS